MTTAKKTSATRDGAAGEKLLSRFQPSLTRRKLKDDQVAITPEFVLNLNPLVDVVLRHVAMRPRAVRDLRDDLRQVFEHSAQDRVRPRGTHAIQVIPDGDAILTTQEAADLVGVSRPFMAARIDAGDVPLFQQVGSQRRVLASAVMTWHRKSRRQRRVAMKALVNTLEGEYPDED